MSMFLAVISTLAVQPAVPAVSPSLAVQPAVPAVSRRAFLGGAAAAIIPAAAFADEAPEAAAPVRVSTGVIEVPEASAPIVLTDEEMAARVARKMELLRQRDAAKKIAPPIQGGSGMEARDGGMPGMDRYIASDYNPEAGINLRSRSRGENLKSAMAKTEEVKKRSTKQKRDDMCEMLGRGC